MSRILIVYTSLTGNTQEIAERIAEGIKTVGSEVVLKWVNDCQADELLKYDGVLLGSYSWGDGELPDEFLDFADDMEGLNLKGSCAAVFGSGDTGYRTFCGAVEVLEEKLRASGASLVQSSLKIEYGPNKEEKELCRDFGIKFAQMVDVVKEQ